MRSRLHEEWQGLLRGLKKLDPQAATVLILYGVFVLIQIRFGSRGFFLTQVAPDASALTAWVWWFGMQAVTGFVLPVAVLVLIFRQRPSAIGLGLGDWKLALWVCALYLPLVVIGTWFLSDAAEFQRSYPHLREAADKLAGIRTISQRVPAVLGGVGIFVARICPVRYPSHLRSACNNYPDHSLCAFALEQAAAGVGIVDRGWAGSGNPGVALPILLDCCTHPCRADADT